MTISYSLWWPSLA